MWDLILSEILKLIPVFVGVFLAFLLDRIIDWYRDRQRRKGLLRDLQSELEGIRDKLTGEGHLHFPDIWESAISSGQIRLLNSTQIRRLASVYREVKGLEYEATRVRDLAEKVRLSTTIKRTSNGLKFMWSHYSAVQNANEKKLLEKINELLREEWWTN